MYVSSAIKLLKIGIDHSVSSEIVPYKCIIPSKAKKCSPKDSTMEEVSPNKELLRDDCLFPEVEALEVSHNYKFSNL